MSIFDSLLGGAVGGETVSIMTGLIEKHGGVQGLVDRLHLQGLGSIAQSWVGPGPNAPISADQIHSAFGADTISALAAKFGLHPQDVAQKLSEALPQAIDSLTPGGAVPARA